MAETIHPGPPSKIWLWLFPLIYLVHITEEYWAGTALSLTRSRMRGANLSPTQFLILTGMAGGLLIAGLLLAQKFRFLPWLMTCVGTVMLVNGLVHLSGSLRLDRYTPGLITGILILFPFGLLVTIRLRRIMSRRGYWSAIFVAVGIQASISLLARFGGKLFTI